MPELLENGGKVSLWGGWTVTLPPSHHQRNDDESWSAWGADWTVDVHIIEVGAGPDGKPATPEALLGHDNKPNLSGDGWVGYSEVLVERDGNRDVFRLAAKLAATNTWMSCWVSYVNQQQHDFAGNIVAGVAHHNRTSAQLLRRVMQKLVTK